MILMFCILKVKTTFIYFHFQVPSLCPHSMGETVVIFRPWDRLQPRVCLELAAKSHVTPPALYWPLISAAALRSPLPELTVKTFPSVISERKPLLILFVDQQQESKAVVAKEEEGKSIAAQLAKVYLDGMKEGRKEGRKKRGRKEEKKEER